MNMAVREITSSVDCEIRQMWQIPEYEVLMWQGKAANDSVVIPVINEGDRIRGLLVRMKDCGISKLADIIIVDGGTTDGSLDLEELKSFGIRGLLVKTGMGKLSAQLRCAYSFVLEHGYDGVVTIDGNNKDDPSAIIDFISALRGGADFIQASRFITGGRAENTPFLRNIAIRLIHAPMLSLSSGFHWTDTTQGFRAYSRKMLLDPKISPFRDIFLTYELLAYMSYIAPRLGYKCEELPTARCYPSNGKTPTKISFLGNLRVFTILIKACLGCYNPSFSGRAL